MWPIYVAALMCSAATPITGVVETVQMMVPAEKIVIAPRGIPIGVWIPARMRATIRLPDGSTIYEEKSAQYFGLRIGDKVTYPTC